jgi:hypothetical protein
MVPDLNRFDGVKPASGEYTISVYMMRGATRGSVGYSLSISIEDTTGDTGAEHLGRRAAGGGISLTGEGPLEREIPT